MPDGVIGNSPKKTQMLGALYAASSARTYASSSSLSGTAPPGATPLKAELDAYVRAELAAYKAPRIWVFLDEFPMTPSGKVQKFVLRDRFVAGDLSPD